MLLAGACLLAYANGLTGTFTYDDKAIVRDNPRIRAPGRVTEIFTTQYFGGPRGTGTAYRPALLLSFAIQWWIHGGEPVAFHVVNVLWHAAAALLLARLFLRLGLTPPVAVGAALLFAVHPIHVEAVTGLVGRGETQSAALCLCFLLLALEFIDRAARRWRWLAGALASFLIACLTKESAAAAPGLLFLCLVWRGEGSVISRAVSALRRGLPAYAGCAVILAGNFWVRARVLGGALKSATTGIFELENPLAHVAAADRVRNASVVVFRYLGEMALPLRLSADESAWSIPLLPPRDWLGWICPLLLVSLLGASIARLSSRDAATLGFLFLAVAFLPSANLAFPTGTIFAERLAYLPSAGFCLIAASWVLGSAPAAHAPPWRLYLFGALALGLASRTVIRNPVWESDEALFTNMVRVSPNSAKAHYDFAYMSAERANPRRALEHYTKATQIYPRYWDAWAGRGRMERMLGDPVAAEAAYAESVRLAPFAENGYFGLGLVREDRGDRAGAERAYRDGLKQVPMSLPLAYRLALLLSSQKRAGALHAWHRALAAEPGSLPARLDYARFLAETGRLAQARAQLREVLRRSPRYGPALRLSATPPFAPG
ncbi:MAG: tetratricopeptide repeat protein [Acidobacteriota bacterium]